MSIDPRIITEFNRRAPFPLTPDKLVVLTHVGSHSHGTYIPPSDPQAIDDVDYMGVVAPPIEFVVGLQRWEGLDFKVEELDVVFYSLEKFIRLLYKNNPNVLGVMWMKPEFYFHWTHQFDELIAARSKFSSLRAFDSFMGYANSQLKRMTAFDAEATREWDEAVEVVTVAGWKVDDITDKSAALPMPKYKALAPFLMQEEGTTVSEEMMDRALNSAKVTIQKMHARHFQGYMGAKRKALVRKYGYDTKNAAHLIRLMRMCNEFLQTGKLNVFRDRDGAELIDIKQGKWTLDEVKLEAEDLFAKVKELKETSRLPENPNAEAIDALLIHLHQELYFPDDEDWGVRNEGREAFITAEPKE